MCGITGYWDLTGARVDPLAFDRFTDSLAHRGPDGRGVQTFLDGSLLLGHRRLAILDPSEGGKQPMSYGSLGNGKARYWIIHNGEVFNFIEIRSELEKRGHRFVSDTDTEVILAAYAEWGVGCLPRFNGMWAFAIWDEREQSLFLSRDRFGVKPLFFRRDAGSFVFASELKSFAFLGEPAVIDPDQLASVIANPFLHEARTRSLLQGVERIRPGHWARVSAHDMQQRRWWNTLEHAEQVPESYDAQVERFLELLTDACRLRMRSDRTVVSCLSGGMDSSAIVSVIARELQGWTGVGSRVANDRQVAVTMSFPGAPNDEAAFAKTVADHTGATWKTVYLPGEYDADDLLETVWASETIYMNAPVAILDTYRHVAGLGYRVTVEGHGSDEMLAGYLPHLVTAMKQARGLAHPLRTFQLARIYAGLAGSSGQWHSYNPLLMAFSHTPLISHALGVARRVMNRTPGQRPMVRQWLRPPELDLDWGGALPELAEATELAADPVKRELYRQFHGSVLPTYLCHFDRLPMHSSVEVRMPFMDWRLVSYCFSLPTSSVIGPRYSKRILRDSMQGLVPETVRMRRDKIGIASPMAKLFNGPLREPIREIVNDPGFLASEVWDGPAIRDHVNAMETWSYHGAQDVWRFVNAHLLTKAFARTTVGTVVKHLAFLALLLAPLLAGSPALAADSDRWVERQAQLMDEVAAMMRSHSRTTLEPSVAAAMNAAPRHEFVTGFARDVAYINRPLDIGYGQTISQPFIVALMTQMLKPEKGHRALEIGTGSGWQAAVLSHLVDEVYTIEIIEELGESAAERLARLGYDNVTTRVGDGYYGWEEYSPFDLIIVTAAASHIPPQLIAQLKPGGRMVIPVSTGFYVEHLMYVEKQADGSVHTEQGLPVTFVPLTGGH